MLITDPRWRPWSLDTEAYTLVRIAQDEIADYPVDLDRCLDSANVLDWLFHIDASARDDQDTLGLIRAMEDLLEPQQHLCAFGKSTTLTPVEMRHLVDAYVRRSGITE